MAGWPNGKALLSGFPEPGKDCGFESRPGRDLLFLIFFWHTKRRGMWGIVRFLDVLSFLLRSWKIKSLNE